MGKAGCHPGDLDRPEPGSTGLVDASKRTIVCWNVDFTLFGYIVHLWTPLYSRSGRSSGVDRALSYGCVVVWGVPGGPNWEVVWAPRVRNGCPVRGSDRRRTLLICRFIY